VEDAPVPDTNAASPLPLPPGHIAGAAAWTGAEMARRRDAWLHTLSEADIAELEAAVAAHRAADRAMGEIAAENFHLPSLAPRLAAILEDLQHGKGFAVLRGLPVERMGTEAAAIAYLGIGAHFGSFRSQNAKGHLLGHVKDLGLDIADPKVRYYQTTRALEYHTDSCDIVGLLCLKTAKAGGESRIVSSTTLYNEILRRRPDLVGELFHPFPTDRRGEVPPGMLPWFEIPVFSWYEGRLTALYSGQYIRSAQANFPGCRRLTAAEIEALDLLDALANDPALNLEIEFRPGDMQFLHNHQILHSRTDFENWPEPERQRHLLRLWLAPREARALPPSFVQRYGSLTPGDRGGILVKDTVLTFTLDPT
jgi:Taurine catabolism dioxygenase TauD, TfdA family